MGKKLGTSIIRFVTNHGSLSALIFGAFLSVVILAVVEVSCRLWLSVMPVRSEKVEFTPEDFIQPDAALGCAAKKNVAAQSVKFASDGRSVFRAVYTIDSHGRRMVPKTNSDSGTENAILFFGCSFVFGEGVNDDETLPYCVQKFAPDYRAYNCALIGYGPQQMLAMLQDKNYLKEIGEREYILIYGYMGEPSAGHIDRAIGSLHVFDWARHFPYYHFDGNAALVRSGSFTSGRPVLSAIYRVALKSAAVKVFGLNWPVRIMDHHVKLTVAIIEESKKIFAKRFNSDKFYVVCFPGAEKRTNEALVTKLRAAGVRCLDYSGQAAFYGKGYRIEGDEHPSPKWNEELGKLLVRDLHLGK